MEKEKKGENLRKKNKFRCYSGPPCTCGFGIRKKSDAVCGFLAYFCAVLRFLDPPYAPLRELKMAKESNDLADLAKVIPESYQKSNELSVNRKNRQNVAIEDRRTFTDKDKVRHIQTLGNDNKDAVLDCESGFHQSEDKRKA